MYHALALSRPYGHCSTFPDSELNFFLERVVVGRKKIQVAKVEGYSEPHPMNNLICLGRISTRQLVQYNSFFVDNEHRKSSKAAANMFTSH